MLASFFADGHAPGVAAQRRINLARNSRAAALIAGAAVAFGGFAYVTAPRPTSLALLLFAACCLAAAARPVLGVHVIVGCTLIGDIFTVPWWPFTKNLSSRESVLFLHHALVITPLEIIVMITCASYLLLALVDTRWRFRVGVLGRPVLVFGAVAVLGVVTGVRGNFDSTVAVYEFRVFLYLVAVYLLVVNVYRRPSHYRQAVTISMLAITAHAVLSLVHHAGLSSFERAQLESLVEHSAALTMNSVFLFAVTLWLFSGRSAWRWWSLVLSVPVAWVYVISQRRAAMVALLAAGVVALVVLHQRERRRFWRLAPAAAVVAALGIAATWNASGVVGLPALAVRSVLGSDGLAAADAGSNRYRELEATNLWATIRSSPLLGKGFGVPFDVVVPMPDISFFEQWQYRPHNSLLWVWLKTGVVGFVTFLYVMLKAVHHGARAAAGARTGYDTAVAFVGLAYVVMFVIYANVDTVLNRPIVFLALALALCTEPAARGVAPVRPE